MAKSETQLNAGSQEWKKRTENILAQLEKQAAAAQLWELSAELCCAISALKRTYSLKMVTGKR
jgi:hypothetical protein